MSKNIKIFLVAVVLFFPFFIVLVMPNIANAQRGTETTLEENVNVGGSCDPGGQFLGLPTWYRYLPAETDPTGRCRPVLENASAALPIGIAILEIMLTLGGVVAVVMIFVGSFQFVLTQGEPDKAAGARRTVINALVGLVILIVATRVVSYIGNRIG